MTNGITNSKVEPGIVLVSFFLVVSGLHEFFLPYLVFLKKLDLVSIQLALIRLSPPAIAHILITLLVPLISIVTGILLLFRKKSGWWATVIVSSFAGFVYLLAFFRGEYFRALFSGYLLALPGIEIDLLVRALLFGVSFVYVLKRKTWSVYFTGEINNKKITIIVLLCNTVFALLMYKGSS